jgi:hypothetical protein
VIDPVDEGPTMGVRDRFSAPPAEYGVWIVKDRKKKGKEEAVRRIACAMPSGRASLHLIPSDCLAVNWKRFIYEWHPLSIPTPEKENPQ